MARDPVKVSVGTEQFQITPLPTSLGLPMYSKLVKSLGPVARGLLADGNVRKQIAAAQKGDDEKADDGAKAKAQTAALELGSRFMTLIIEGIEAMPTETVVELSGVFAKHCKVLMVGGMWVELEPIFDEHFAAKYMLLTQWLIACLRVNFPDFLASLVAFAARAPAA